MFSPTISPKKVRSPKLYSLEEYLAKEEQAEHKHEYFNGYIIEMAGAKAKHNQIALQTASAILVAVKQLQKKYKVYNSNMSAI